MLYVDGNLPKSVEIISIFEKAHISPRELPPIQGVAQRLVRHHEVQWDAEDRSRVVEITNEALGKMKTELDSLNRQRINYIDDLDLHIEEIVTQSGDVPPHTETYGSIIDRLAIAWVRVNKLSKQTDTPRENVQLAELILDDLAAGYDVLLEDVSAGRRRLPSWRTFKVYKCEKGRP